MVSGTNMQAHELCIQPETQTDYDRDCGDSE